MNTKSSKRIISTTVLAAIIVFSMLAISTAPASAATEEEIEKAIVNGTAYLASHQNGDGSWGTSEKVAHTGLVLLKLQERAHDLNLDPYDNDPTSPEYYEYADNVIAGMDYMLGEAEIDIGHGIRFAPGHHEVYNTAIALCALGVSDPDRTYNIDGTDYTYKEIAQNVTDWMAYAQIDSGTYEGGWRYQANYASGDNSNSGWATLGLAYAQDFGCTIPSEVKVKLNKWIDYIQNDVNGDANDGGSGYTGPNDWVNILKTGNLLQQMALYGDTYPGVQRVLDAKHYLERHWRDASNDPGWGYSLDPSDYHAMFTTMKGLVSMKIDLIDTDGDGVQDDDWFNQTPPADPPQDFASTLVAQQNDDGSWPNCHWGNNILCTAWALLTLEKIAPQPDPWVDINKELDELIEKVDAATMPNIIKQRLIDKLEYAKALKDNAKEECEAGNFEGALKKLGVAKSQVESFASMVKITRRISPADKASFLADSSEIIGKIDRLIEYIETEHKC